jgi:hypothetical protein
MRLTLEMNDLVDILQKAFACPISLEDVTVHAEPFSLEIKGLPMERITRETKQLETSEPRAPQEPPVKPIVQEGPDSFIVEMSQGVYAEEVGSLANPMDLDEHPLPQDLIDEVLSMERLHAASANIIQKKVQEKQARRVLGPGESYDQPEPGAEFSSNVRGLLNHFTR